jgi:hypothetical protein
MATAELRAGVEVEVAVATDLLADGETAEP